MPRPSPHRHPRLRALIVAALACSPGAEFRLRLALYCLDRPGLGAGWSYRR